ncbi:MAG: hypothetical protein AAFY16_01785 [Cyanobacteria bacterium J06642_3]
MLIAKVFQFFLATETNINTRRSQFWLCLGLGFSIVYSLIALRKAFNGDYLVQDDARQHVFWMSRFIDPELFPNDLIADYFQSIAPWGYQNIYRLAANLGIEPLVFNKFIPGILGIIMTIYCFAVSLELFPIPFGAFVTTLLFNQNIWRQEGLISGTPRNFAYPLFFIFLYYLLKRSLLGVCLAILLASLFYPTLVLIFAGVLLVQLWQIDGYQLRLCQKRQTYLFSITGLAVALVVLFPYIFSTAAYAPVITMEEARSLPEFFSGGRASFFDDDTWDFWFNGSRSGIKLSSALSPQLAYGGLLLPLLLRFPNKFSLSQKINPAISSLRDLLIASFGLFFAAHALLFRLHLPSRYTVRSLRVIVIIAASITLMLLLEAIFRWAINSQTYLKVKSITALVTVVIFLTALIGYPATRNSFVKTGYQRGLYPELYQFLQQQPKDILIASLTREADLIPSFTKRSILVSREYAIPYHLGYYKPFRQRVIDLIEAQYTSDLEQVKRFINHYQIDFWLIEKSSFTPEYLTQNRWLQDHQPATAIAINNLIQGNGAIAKLQNSCSVFQDNQHSLLNTDCIRQQ